MRAAARRRRCPSPYRRAHERGWFARLLARTADVATWKDLAYLIAHLPLAVVDLIAVVLLLAPPFALILAPFTGEVQNFAVALALLPAGLVLLPISVRALSAFAGIHAAVARALLTTSRESELNARVVDLRTSQARIIAAADAERRRLERDLHDGAQQRLVAVALNLRVASERLKRGDDALDLVDQAGDEAQRAIGELRDLARGIHPAVLTERGLGPALRDVAGRCPVPVTVIDELRRALPADGRGDRLLRRLRGADERGQVRRGVESATVVVGRRRRPAGDRGLRRRPRRRRPRRGSGLRGLGDRIAALDGTLEVDSPVGEGTSVRAELAVAERREEERGVVLDERAAAILRLRRRRGLVTHAAVFGVFQIAMIAIWALTGMGEFWPGWTILLWGVVLALHASLAILRQPITRLRGVPRYSTTTWWLSASSVISRMTASATVSSRDRLGRRRALARVTSPRAPPAPARSGSSRATTQLMRTPGGGS